MLVFFYIDETERPLCIKKDANKGDDKNRLNSFEKLVRLGVLYIILVMNLKNKSKFLMLNRINYALNCKSHKKLHSSWQHTYSDGTQKIGFE